MRYSLWLLLPIGEWVCTLIVAAVLARLLWINAGEFTR